ncbi:uncharacterized protein LOC131675984 [Topomyia yanbarensis]|uniref:uncharacterized protein LOC131675984 n=1 Tax=Topomyia yanbarensis TaxID=2498891 RepID=UPI00273AF285|nr:uncharacterized protein LOC131675984 [Topomyia yanbarensis]
MAREVKALLKRERQLQNSLTFIDKFIQNYDDERDARQLSVRLNVLEQVGAEYYTVRAKLELLQEEEEEKKQDGAEPAVKEEALHHLEETNYQAMHDFDDRFCTLKAELLELQLCKDPLHTSHNDSDSSAHRTSTSISRVKLPEIRLPSFGGRIHEWVTFRDTFRSLIDQSTQLNEIDKFTFLRASLSGEALQEINSVEISAANYDVAWKALQERYENKKLLVKAYLDALFFIEPLKKESYDGLSQLIGQFEKNLQMLEKIGESTENWSTILAYMVCTRLDSSTLRQWESHHNSKDVPNYRDLMGFLRSQCSVLQSISIPSKMNSDPRSQKVAVCHTLVKTSGKCPFCGESWHSAFQCVKFQKQSVPDRISAVMRSKLCRNCLRPGHVARTCERGACHHCHQRHHSMLHTETPQAGSSVSLPQSRPQTVPQQPRQPQTKQHGPNQQIHTHPTNAQTNTANSHNTTTLPSNTNTASTSQTCIALPNAPTHNIVLSTALVTVKDRQGNSLLARALLDSCSQHCLMTASFSNKLKFRESPAFLCIQGIGSSSVASTRSVSVAVAARSSEISSYAEEMCFHVLPKLTLALPTASFNPSQLCLPEAAALADPWFYESGPIDMIIGAEYYVDLFEEGRYKATEDGPTLQKTVFGWIVSGRVPSSSSSGAISTTYVCSTAEIQDQLAKFWELETCRTTSTNSTEESACEKIFSETTFRDETGRFVVTLPKRQSIIKQLGDSKGTAVKRFMSLERRLAANPELKAQYSEFIHEYQALGHMSEVVDDTITPEAVYHLPHHAILKPDSTTTKLRVVFDASCRTSSGYSLNDALMVGPVVQDDLLDVILRFRLHRHALVADIAKMYRMVQVQPADQPLQRILWRDSSAEPIKIFQLTTVTYGTASAPYLATKCLQTLAEDGQQTHPIAAKVVRQDFYVDDMLSGVDEPEEGRMIVNEMISLMESAGFLLRKWNSNCREILLEVPEHLRDDRTILQLDSPTSTVKTLGLLWEPSTDRFQFSTPQWNSSALITKRTVLSDVSRLFDPLGLVGPVIIQAKMFIQELWKLDCGWDEPLAESMQDHWHEYRRNLTGLEGLSVPRWVDIRSNTIDIQLHGFCDASEKAYGACIYVRSISNSGSVAVHLLASKSRVAPLENLKKKKQRQTIPRLELSSALLLSHLYERVVSSTHITAPAFFWTDSMIVKCWLASSPSRWKEFVANRVSEIQHITKGSIWNHVSGVENAADIVSRGMTPAQLQYQSLWFGGPHWLLPEQDNWPGTLQACEDSIDRSVLEEKGAVVAVLKSVSPGELFNLRSTYTGLVRLTAYICRFRFNAQAANRNCRNLGSLTVKELDGAVRTLVSLSQRECFPQKLADLTNNRPLRNSSILSLDPQLIEGILCVGGRLRHAHLSNSRKHPFILDRRHPLARIVMEYYHQKLFHAGQQLLISAVRERFWPTFARDLARSVIHKCVACFRVKPRVQDQLMADLPPERVTPCLPFRRVGVDYCGPFLVGYPYRKNRPVKCFVAIYVCLVTKAVHLELAADLTTQAFLATLKRFSSRRGKPELIMCDNARNFVGAKRELDELRKLFNNQQFQEQAIREASEDKIDFKFIPARSPNFGGLWESAVKSFKTLFKRTIGTRSLLHDEMLTVLVQIEAILNSRPLTPVSNDPADFEALTPGHFLIHRPLTAIPEPNLESIPEGRLAAWQRNQQFLQQLWKRWSEQYLSDLQNRTRWMRRKENLAIGTMVVLKDENQPPLKW